VLISVVMSQIRAALRFSVQSARGTCFAWDESVSVPLRSRLPILGVIGRRRLARLCIRNTGATVLRFIGRASLAMALAIDCFAGRGWDSLGARVRLTGMVIYSGMVHAHRREMFLTIPLRDLLLAPDQATTLEASAVAQRLMDARIEGGTEGSSTGRRAPAQFCSSHRADLSIRELGYRLGSWRSR
jgi:hypothetical protein